LTDKNTDFSGGGERLLHWAIPLKFPISVVKLNIPVCQSYKQMVRPPESVLGAPKFPIQSNSTGAFSLQRPSRRGWKPLEISIPELFSQVFTLFVVRRSISRTGIKYDVQVCRRAPAVFFSLAQRAPLLMYATGFWLLAFGFWLLALADSLAQIFPFSRITNHHSQITSFP
jgi:hypothetical protein